MIKKAGLISFLLLLFFTLSGCWDQNLYEKTGFILEAGFETSGSRIKASFTSPVIEASKGGGQDVEFITVEVNSVREGRETANLSAAKNLEAGKLQQVLFSEELASKGIQSFLEIFQRDPVIPPIAWVVVVDGSPSELLKTCIDFKDKPRPAFYINSLMEKSYKRSIIPHTQIYDFDIDFFAPGLDPITPVIKLSKNKLSVEGTALFHNDKMVGKINTRETQLLLGAMGQFNGCEYAAKTVSPEGQTSAGKMGIDMTLLKCKRSIKIHFENNIPAADISVVYTGRLDENVWTDSHVINLREMEKYAEKDMQLHYDNLFSKLKESGSDPIGIGNIIRAEYNNYWKETDWDQMYKKMKFNVSVKVNLTSEGIIR